LGASAALAFGSEKGSARYTTEQVRDAFAEQGFTLTQPDSAAYGWTAYAPVANGAFLLPRDDRGPFYVFVASSNAAARLFYRDLVPEGEPREADGSFQLVRGNVVVADVSLPFSHPQRDRVRTAVNSLPWDERSFREAFEQVEVGMAEEGVLELLGTPFEELGPGGALGPPLEGTPTRIWYYGPSLTSDGGREPLWSVGFRRGRVLLLNTPEA
jgi:hypothetical protein